MTFAERAPTFAERAQDRNNHFNLIRLVAAFVVLGAHNTTLLGVEFAPEPFIHSYGIWFGTVAVNVFFVVSGFLVTASLFNRASLTAFIWARFLRIFPGLWVMLLITVFGIGLAMTSLPVAEYLTSSAVYKYLWRCATVVNGMVFTLPGVFQTNVHTQHVNASLWTICIEWRMYEYLAIAWAVLAVRPDLRRPALRAIFPLVALAIFAYILLGHRQDFGAANTYLFFAGSGLYMLGDKIPASFRTVPILLGVLAVALIDKQAFYFVYLLVLPLIVINLAYAPGERLLRFNKLGDYSYGLYIYAFPIQQALVALYSAQSSPVLSWAVLTFASGALTLGVAILSWHYVERPALARKEICAAATLRWFGRLRARFARLTWPTEAPAAHGRRPEPR